MRQQCLLSDLGEIMKSKPTFQNWALAAVSVMFVVMGLIILSTDINLGITTIALFGVCALVHIRNVLRKLRYGRLQKGVVNVTGGVPITPSCAKVFTAGAIALGLGAILIVFDNGSPVLIQACAWLIALVGFAVLAALAAGLIPGQYFQFDVEGMIFGYRQWSVFVPWDRISYVYGGEWASNPTLFIWFHSTEDSRVTPASKVGSFLKLVDQNRAWIGADMFLMTEQYGIDLPILVQAMERFISHPASRAELTRHNHKQLKMSAFR
jgi:hypothetical protein